MSPSTISALPYLGAGTALGMMIIAWLWHISLAGSRTERLKREMEHTEKLKAIECGYPVDNVKPTSAAVSIGVGVPSSAFGIAFVSSFFGAAPYAWPAAAVVGAAAVICGTILALRQPTLPNRPPGDLRNGKMALDPDAYDTAGRRG